MKISNFFKYMKTLTHKIELKTRYYDKYSTNPFLDIKDFNSNYDLPMHEKTYIWIEKKSNLNYD